jgi:DNA repair exonuclease SbcCD ATPase subunit|tara:strand:+ start:11796 stop:13511 length:1716 start_codon:yes stop_codon:yes gene_type:complete
MIKFKKLRFKNFLSTGNNFTSVDFDTTPTTLVVGQNGAGKSTMLDALSFGLFGKPHRKISKGQLVNTINQKGTLVEVEFSIGTQNYKVVRGIKPNLFEIWVNGNMVNQDSHAKEYQSMLEKNILMLSHKSFHQIVVLGSSSFVPFMQLAGGSRREVIEDLLDINMFSKMNSLLKEKMSILKDQIANNSHQINLVDTKINAQKKYLRDLSDISFAQKKEKLDTIKTLQDDIRVLNESNAKVTEDVIASKSVTTEIVSYGKQLNELNEFAATFKNQQKNVVKQAKFFEENDRCPTCDQDIDKKLKEYHLNKCKTKAGTIASALEMHTSRKDDIEQIIEGLTRTQDNIRSWQSKVDANTQEIMRINRNIDTLNNEVSRIDNETGDLSEANTELETLRTDKEELQDNKYKLNEQHSYNQVYAELLKDTGIKTKIIKQYLPVMNQLTNKYLQILDFFVHFDLDESFVETIRSRHRDNFSYDSFSEGEKQRIDLSLLFTWRQIAKMKNSVATNLLILDETFDSSLDEEGIENLMKIISTLGEDTNVFVISHKSELEDAHFHRKIEFVKEKNFSKIKA